MNDYICNTNKPKKPIKITLKQLLEINDLLNYPDIHIIKEWFTKNDLEEEGIELISDLAQSKIRKLQYPLESIRNWDLLLTTVQGRETFMKFGYDKKTAMNLEIIERIGLLNLDLKECEVYEWAKNTIPTLNVPKVFFIPTLKYLQKYDIYFKDTPKEKVDTYAVDYWDASVR